MGAWPTMALKLPGIAGRAVGVISLPASGPPAVGSATAHKAEHQHLVDEALPGSVGMYFTDRGIEELLDRRADDEVSLGWLAERLREFVDLFPEAEATVERLATWLARLDEDDPD